MGFFDALFEPRAIDHSKFEFGDPLWTPSDSGENVTPDSAMRLTAVWACVTLITNTIRAMPVDVYRKQDESRQPVARPPAWLGSPNPDQTWGQFLDLVLHSLLTRGNAFLGITDRNAGFPAELYVQHPDDVSVKWPKGGHKEIWVQGERFQPFTAARPDGQVLHILGHSSDGIIGLSPVEKAAQAIGLGLATEKFGAKFFGQGAQPGGVVEMPPNSSPTPDQLKTMSAEFRRKFAGTGNAWKPVVLANGATYKPITLPNDQSQFIESRQFSIGEISRLFGVPPHLIADTERSTSWGPGIEQQNIGFVTYTLNPWITRLEEAFSLMIPRGQYVKFNSNSLLRGDIAARAAYYQVMGPLKTMTINEIRALEDLPPLEGGNIPPPAPNESI